MWEKDRLLYSNKYRVIEKLGKKGGYGTIYLAEELTTKNKVAIKIPRVQRQNLDRDKIIERFRKESQILSQIDSPNIIKKIDYFQEESIPCIVMPYVEGETLQEFVESNGCLHNELLTDIFIKLAKALQKLHQRNYIHADIHPKNIIITKKREPILIDFGSVESFFERPKIMTENTYYVPYEQRRENPIPEKNMDIYSLSATMYFAATGQPPENSEDRIYFDHPLASPRKLNRDLDKWLENAILKGMELEPKNRPLSMEQWIEFLRETIKEPKKQIRQKTELSNLSLPQLFRKLIRELKKIKLSELPFPQLVILAIAYMPVGMLLSNNPSETSEIFKTFLCFLLPAMEVSVVIDLIIFVFLGSALVYSLFLPLILIVCLFITGDPGGAISFVLTAIASILLMILDMLVTSRRENYNDDKNSSIVALTIASSWFWSWIIVRYFVLGTLVESIFHVCTFVLSLLYLVVGIAGLNAFGFDFYNWKKLLCGLLGALLAGWGIGITTKEMPSSLGISTLVYFQGIIIFNTLNSVSPRIKRQLPSYLSLIPLCISTSIGFYAGAALNKFVYP